MLTIILMSFVVGFIVAFAISQMFLKDFYLVSKRTIKDLDCKFLTMADGSVWYRDKKKHSEIFNYEFCIELNKVDRNHKIEVFIDGSSIGSFVQQPNQKVIIKRSEVENIYTKLFDE